MTSPTAIGPERRAGRETMRAASIPTLRYPPELPVTERRGELVDAIAAHQVLVVAGETGSGKTTQIPKLCLEAGRGVAGMIGHTQPRRLAARTVAERIASEMDSPLGQLVGYTIRFTDRVSDSTLIKVMTDGILLAEIQRDRLLRRYDTLIIDEAHERSLNIDFLLGYLKTLLPRRPDLKLIITSATIDTERFARHFDAPVIEVSGRTYPVEVRYQPVIRDAADAEAERDQLDAINDAVDELSAEGPGDILVFLSGEREIRDTAESLTRRELPNTQILPLYARLSGAEQHRVFEPHTGRRIVLATNVAETSLTVPGIHYVIDPGTARISRYSARTKVQRLPIEAVSQASADQRAGRCGRVAAGICVRLYSEEDYAARPEFTEPEILRTNLASVILQMAVSRLGDIAAFPFLDPPDSRSVADGIALLEELGALESTVAERRAAGRPLRPTRLGRDLARLPLDPRLGRMVLEAGRLGCLREVMIITAALSIQDPRERPVDAAGAAAEAHGRFADPESDFLAYVKLWDYLAERAGELGSSAFRRLCRREFLNYLRVREWQDLYAQLRSITHPLGLRPNREPAPRAQVHQALLAGLLSHIGVREGERTDYLGARGARFALFPSSSLSRRPPRWVMAEELVETSRLWAREAARIEPAWAERLGAHLLVHHYSEPHWEPERASVMAWERATLFGVPVVARRRVPYARVDPAEARELFIRHALVDGDWAAAQPGGRHEVLAANRALIEEVRSRRRDVSVSEELLWDHYDRLVGAQVTSGRSFDAWWKTARRGAPELLRLRLDDLAPPEERLVLDREAFPDTWFQPAGPGRDPLDLALTYHFEPGAPDDGVSVHIPLAVLNQVSADGFDWQVPGLREELITEVIRSLPKDLRRAFVPVPDHVAAFQKRAGPEDGPLLEVLRRVLTGLTGDPLPPGAWRLDRVPAHLRVTFVVETPDGQTLATSKDLGALQARLAPLIRRAVAGAVDIVESSGQTSWTFGTIPEEVTGMAVTGVAGGHGPGVALTRRVRGYPALVDEGASVGLRVLVSPAEASHAMAEGTRRLLDLAVPPPGRRVQGRLTNAVRLALAAAPHRSAAALWADIHAAALDHLLALHGGPVRDESSWDRLSAEVRADLEAAEADVAQRVAAALVVAQRLERRLDTLHAPVLSDALIDVAAQVGGLVYPGFVAASGVDRLGDIERYLLAAERRLDLLIADPARDRARMLRIQRLEKSYRAATSGDRAATGEAEALRWLLEELRVSLFAQALGTRGPVSEDRVRRALADLARG